MKSCSTLAVALALMANTSLSAQPESSDAAGASVSTFLSGDLSLGWAETRGDDDESASNITAHFVFQGFDSDLLRNVVVQLRHRDVPDDPLDEDFPVSQAFVTLDPGPVSLRLGLIPVSFGLLNESGSSRPNFPLFTLPRPFYPAGQIATALGASLAFAEQPAGSWTLDGDLHVAFTNPATDRSDHEEVEGGGGQLRLTRNNVVLLGGIQLHAVERHPAGLASFRFDETIGYVGAEWRNDAWWLGLEYRAIDFDREDLDLSDQGGYALIERRFGDTSVAVIGEWDGRDVFGGAAVTHSHRGWFFAVEAHSGESDIRWLASVSRLLRWRSDG